VFASVVRGLDWLTSCVLYCHCFLLDRKLLLVNAKNYSYLVGSLLHCSLALYLHYLCLYSSSQYGLFVTSLSSVKCTLAVACATGRASHTRRVKGDDPDKKGYPGPPGWGLGVRLTTTPLKKMLLRNLKRRPRPTQGCRADDDDDDDECQVYSSF
jgi:hypothetical protein